MSRKKFGKEIKKCPSSLLCENSEIQQIHRDSRLDLLGRHSKGKRNEEELADIKTDSIKNTKAKECTTEGKHLA